MSDEMCYVAADPEQPGAAWAICIDDSRYAKYTAKDLSTWTLKGANVMRVTYDVALEMLKKWVRPDKGETKCK